MCEKLEYEGKNLEEIIQNCLTEHNIEEKDIIVTESDEKNSWFKGKKSTAKIVLKKDIKEYLKEFFKTLAKYMNIEINCEIKENDNTFDVILVSDNNAILIGKEGKNLDAIQTIVRNIVKKITNNNAKKISLLEKEVKNLAKEVLQTKVDVKLDPMNSYERMIVHNYISKYENLSTESIGEEPNRYVVIKYKEN